MPANIIAERHLTPTRKLAKPIKQIMKKDAAKERLKERLTMIQVMLICLERDTRRSNVFLQNVLPCGCMCFICVLLDCLVIPSHISGLQAEGEKKGESGEKTVQTMVL